MQGSKILRKAIMLTLLAVGLLCVFYFSWLPSPNIGSLPYFPRSFGNWINYYGNLRTAIPFLFLGAVSEITLKVTQRKNEKRALILACLISTVSLAEAGQLLLPKRHFDILDITWGALGAIAGMLVSGICKWILQNNLRPRK